MFNGAFVGGLRIRGIGQAQIQQGQEAVYHAPPGPVAKRGFPMMAARKARFLGEVNLADGSSIVPSVVSTNRYPVEFVNPSYSKTERQKMRTLFDLSVPRDSWTPNMGGPLSIGQASIEDILKATVTGGATAATEYEKAQEEKAKAAAEQARAQTAAAQARGAAAVAASQNPTVLGMPPLLAGVLGLGIVGIIIAVVATR